MTKKFFYVWGFKLLLIFLLFLPNSIEAQVKIWQRIYGGLYADQGYSIQQTTDGGYIAAGLYTVFWGRGTRCLYNKT